MGKGYGGVFCLSVVMSVVQVWVQKPPKLVLKSTTRERLFVFELCRHAVYM